MINLPRGKTICYLMIHTTRDEVDVCTTLNASETMTEKAVAKKKTGVAISTNFHSVWVTQISSLIQSPSLFGVIHHLILLMPNAFAILGRGWNFIGVVRSCKARWFIEGDPSEIFKIFEQLDHWDLQTHRLCRASVENISCLCCFQVHSCNTRIEHHEERTEK